MPDKQQNSFVAFLRESWQWLAIGGLGAGSIVLGYIGYWRYQYESGTMSWDWNVLYKTLQLFVMQTGDMQGPVPWPLNCARFLAPVVPVWTAVKGATIVFRDQFRMLRLRRMKNHVVICGLGRKGLQLIRDFRDCGDSVVVIEIDPENGGIQGCWDSGAIVLIGDANDKALLRKARAERAKFVIAITGDDGTNVDIAVLTYQLVRERSEKIKELVICYVHVVNLKLATALGEYRVLSESADPFEARIFNIFQNSARSLFESHPLDYTPFPAADPRHIHLIIVGFGKMGESVLLQAAKIGHYANGKKLHVSIIDKLASEKQGFFSRYPHIDESCNIEFLKGEVADPDIVDKIRQWVNDESAMATIVICLDGGSASLSAALGVVSKLENLDVPILVRLVEEMGLAALLDCKESCSDLVSRVDAFGMINQTCTRRILLREKLDVLARAIQDSFIESQKSKRSMTEPTMQSWDKLDESYRDSNRQQADHIPIKLRAIGCYSAGSDRGDPVVEKFTDDEVATMARMEHARWCAERFIAGWTYGESRDAKRRKNPNLVPWERLSEEIKDLNYRTILDMHVLLQLVGEKIYRGEDGAAVRASDNSPQSRSVFTR